MARVVIDTNRGISDHLIERIPGQMYDVYYRSIEELARTNVDLQVQDTINNTFIQTADAEGLKRWEYFYTYKPNDMSDDEWRAILIVLNETTREGPTAENILKLLRLFDPTASFTSVSPYPVYANSPSAGNVNVVRGSALVLVDTVTTTYPWYAGTYGPIPTIYWTDSSGILHIYDDPATQFVYTLRADALGAHLEIEIIWDVTTAPTSGDTYTIVFPITGVNADTAVSEFYNETTNAFPTPEYVMLSENTSYSTDNEFIIFDNAFILYITSILSIAKFSYRQLLKDLLDMVLPANVIFSLRFDSKPPVYWGVQDFPLTRKEIAVYATDYETLTRADINISGQEAASITGLLAISNTEYLVILAGAGGITWSNSLFKYNVSTDAFVPIDTIGFGSWQLSDLHNGSILIATLSSSRKEYRVYNKTAGALIGTTQNLSSILSTSESVQLTASTPGGDGVFVVCNAALSGVGRYKVYVLNIFANTVIHSFNLPVAAGPFYIHPLNNEKFVVCYEGGTQYYVDFSTGAAVSTPISLTMSRYTQDQVLSVDAQHVYFGLNNADGTYRIYASEFGSTVAPTLFYEYVGISSLNGGCKLFISGNDMIIATKFKRIIYIANYTSASPTVTDKYLDILTGSSYNTIPYGILE